MTTALVTVWAAWLVVGTTGYLRGERRTDAVDGFVSAAVLLAATATGLWFLAPLAALGVCVRAVASVRAQATPRIRQRGLLVVLGGAAFLATAAVGTLVTSAVPHERVAVSQLLVFGSIAVPVAMIVASSRGVRGQADRLAVDGVPAFGSVTLVLCAVTLSIALNESRLAQLAWASVCAFGAVAASVPLHRWLRRGFARLMFGMERAPREILRTLGTEMSRAVPLEELLQGLVRLLREHLGLSSAELWTGQDDLMRRTASPPQETPLRFVPPEEARRALSRGAILDEERLAALEVPLGASKEHVRVAGATHGGVLHGVLVARRPLAGAAFHESEERILEDVANVVGATLKNAVLDAALQASRGELQERAAELRRSRARVVAAGDEVRRRLERDLHDGAQQTLAGLAVSTRVVRDLVAAGRNDDALALLDDFTGEIRQAIEELRALAHGVYPPALEAGGLVDALPAATKRLGAEVEFRFDGIQRYHPRVEASVYFCCLEAIANALKHGAPPISVELRGERDNLYFEIRDHGYGFDLEDATASARGGLINMTDRTGALGGDLWIQTRAGEGCAVNGWVPAVSPP